MKRRGRLSIAALVAALTLMLATAALADDIGVYGPVAGETVGKKATFHADVYTNKKGKAVRVSGIQLQWIDFQCTRSDGHHFVIDSFEYDFPSAKVVKKGDRYVFSASNGSFDKLTSRITKKGERLRGSYRIHEKYTDGELAGSTCDSQSTFKAKAYYLY